MSKLLQRFETGLFWLVLILFAFIPLYPKFPLINVSGTFVAIRIEDFLIGFTLFLWIIYLLVSGSFKVILRDYLNQAILLFFFIGALSLFSAVFLTQTVNPNLGMLHFLRRVEFMMLLPVVIMAIKTRKQIIGILITLALTTIVVDIYALGQRYLSWPVISTGNSEFSKGLILYLTPGARVNSTFAGHYDLAVFLMMALIIITALFFYKQNIFYKLSLFSIGVFSFVVLVMTAARISFVAMVLGMISILILLKKKAFLTLVVLLAIIGVAYPSQLRDRFVSTITINMLDKGQRYIATPEEQAINSLNIPNLPRSKYQYFADASATANTARDIAPGEPINTTQLGVYRSFGIRLDQEWPRAIRAFMKNPLLGTGYSSIGLATDNDLLRLLGEVGLLGTISFIFIFIVIMKRLWRGFKVGDQFTRFLSVGALSMILAFWTNALFIDVFEASKVATLFWLTSGLVLAANRNFFENV